MEKNVNQALDNFLDLPEENEKVVKIDAKEGLIERVSEVPKGLF